MSDAQQDSNPIFNLQRIYLKDLSLELPNAPQVFLVGESPVVDVAMNIGAQNLDENVYEVEVVATVTTKVNEDVLYLVEVKQAGIFNIANMPEDQLDPILGIMCPNIIYPYLRANVADIISRASLPPLHLAEINFQAFYEQRLAQQAQAEGSDIVVPADAKLN